MTKTTKRKATAAGANKIAELADKQLAAEWLRRLMADLANVVGKLPNRSHNKHSILSKDFRRKHL